MLDSSLFWIDTLAPFRQGTPLLPPITLVHDAGGPARQIVAAQSGRDVSAEVLALGALVLVVSRYNGAEPLLIASPAEGDGTGLVFLAHTLDESQSAPAFLDALRLELDTKRRHAPCALDRTASGLGITAGQATALLRLAFAFGAV